MSTAVATVAWLTALGSNLTSTSWWKAAGVRALYTAVATAVPYLTAASLLTAVPWATVGSVTALSVIASLATSLAGLPEASGTDVPWWLAATERVTKQFFQTFAAGLVGATLLSDVPWEHVLDLAAGAATVAFARLILATLPTSAASTLAVSSTGIVTTVSATLDAGTTDDGATVVTTVPEPTTEDQDATATTTAADDTTVTDSTAVESDTTGESTTAAEDVPSLDWSRDRLAAYAKTLGLSVTTKATKPSILAAINTALTATGD